MQRRATKSTCVYPSYHRPPIAIFSQNRTIRWSPSGTCAGPERREMNEPKEVGVVGVDARTPPVHKTTRRQKKTKRRPSWASKRNPCGMTTVALLVT